MGAGGELFQAAVSALFAPHESAYSLFYAHGKDPAGSLISLRAVQDPAVLPQFWTLSCPSWVDTENWDDAYTDFSWGDQTRTLKQTFNSTKDGWLQCDAFIQHPPFLVFEVDYLLCDKDGDKNISAEADAARKQLQADAMAVAFQRSGFPFAVMVHSGSKSIHAYVRLSDPLETIAAFRGGEAFKLLQELAWTVFGHYDQNVMKESGRVRLVRTPGATREDGSLQKILAVGKPTTITDLFQWFYSQLSPAALQEITSRAPLPKQTPLRKYWLRIQKWRHDVAQLHEPGERGGHWMFVAKSLAMAGCKEPQMLRKPQQQGDLGEWNASWLWWASAFIFDRYARGWFFSPDLGDWKDEKERVRHWDSSTVSSMIVEQRVFEKFNPETASLADMLVQSKEQEEDRRVNDSLDGAGMPAVADAPGAQAPQHHQGGITGEQAPLDSAANPKKAGEQPEKEKKKPKALDYNAIAATFLQTAPNMQQLTKVRPCFGGQWYVFPGRIWEQTDEPTIRSLLHHGIMQELTEKHKSEVVNRLEHEKLYPAEWRENPSAVAFNNGTLRISQDAAVFETSHDYKDGLRSLVPFEYNEQAQCPNWIAAMERFLPDESRRLVIQEMVGYTLMPGQPFQAFFLLLGTGANFKGTLLKIIEAMHGGDGKGVAGVSVATLADKFALGDVWNKRVAIDGDATNLGNKAGATENAVVTSVIKAWTGGDSMSIQSKGVQPWTARMNPKLIMAANRRPKLVDSSNGLWRRLRIIKFETILKKEEIIADYDKKLIEHEMPGIINWAIIGLRRLLQHQHFTRSAIMEKDAEEYKEESNSVLRFLKDYMEPNPNSGWYDIRPVYFAYSAFCTETGAYSCGESEFIDRLRMEKVEVAKPAANEFINMAKVGAAPVNGLHYWCLRGWKCQHPALNEMPTQGISPKQTPGPIQFPMKAKS